MIFYVLATLFLLLFLLLIVFMMRIAKFYQLKSGKPVYPNAYWLGGLLFAAGQVLGWSPGKPPWLSQVAPWLTLAGCFLLGVLCLFLYKNMMSVNE